MFHVKPAASDAHSRYGPGRRPALRQLNFQSCQPVHCGRDLRTRCIPSNWHPSTDGIRTGRVSAHSDGRDSYPVRSTTLWRCSFHVKPGNQGLLAGAAVAQLDLGLGSPGRDWGGRWCCRPGISPTPSSVRDEGAGLLPQSTDRPRMDPVERRLKAAVCRRLSIRTRFHGATCGGEAGVGTQTRWFPVGRADGPAANVEYVLGWPSSTFPAPGCGPPQSQTSGATFHVERASLRIAAVGLTLQRYSSGASGLAGRAFRLGSQLGRDSDRESDGHCFSIKSLS